MTTKKWIKKSLIGFNGSPNCDHSSVGAFLQSYKNRKEEIIEGKEHALQGGNTNVNKEKLWWQRESLDFVLDMDNAEFVCQEIQRLLDSKAEQALSNL